LPDWQEVAVSHTDPTSGDSDKDRVTDAMELSLGMDPLSKDTDRDGRADGYEIRHGSDPLKPGSAFDEGSLAAGQDVDSGYDHHSADAVDLN
jgi:Bacterial TSP3 repeat